MFLRSTKRFKDGKQHTYWSMVESVRGERKGSFKDEFFYFLRDQWAGLFGSTCDVVLFDLTSTYFEVDGTGSGDRPRMGNFNAGQWGQSPCGHFPSAYREDLSMGGES